MSDVTRVHKYPFPLESDIPDVPLDMQKLAEKIEETIPQFFLISAGSNLPKVGDPGVSTLRHLDVCFVYEP